MSSRKTAWYIRQWPPYVVSINRVLSYDEQFDGVHIKYMERDFGIRPDPFWRETISAVVPRSEIAFSYTDAVNKVRDILKDFNANEDSLESFEDEQEEETD